MLKSFKYRLYPSENQADYLNQNFGATRYLWNHLVENFNSYKKGEVATKVNEKTLKEEFLFLKDVISYALQQKRLDFDETKKQFFSKTRKTKLGRMKFKAKGRCADSFRLPGQSVGFNECIDFEKNTIKIPKISPIRIVIDRKFKGQLKSITISKNKANQYFVSVLVDEPLELKQNAGRSIGIDLGLKHLAILSDGTKVDNPKWFSLARAKLN